MPVGKLGFAGRTMFLSTAQGSDATATARLREAARYCKFEILTTSKEST